MLLKLVCILSFSCVSVSATDLVRNFKAGLDLVMHHYDQRTGLWIDQNCVRHGSCMGNQGLWYWANASQLLANYQGLTGDKPYYAHELTHIFTRSKALVRKNNYLDDEGWWALALIAAYRTTHRDSYLHRAELLVTDMHQRGAQAVCYGKGGIYWNAQKTQVGSIANELFLTINAQLYLLTHKAKYKRQANATWEWFKHSGLLNPDYTIADNYEVRNGSCGPKINWQFTYTHGVILAGLADLAKIDQDKNLLTIAQTIARHAMYNFSLGGMLTEICTSVSNCAEDAFLFKGIFVYDLAYLAKNTADQAFKSQVKHYLTYNYQHLVANQGENAWYGFSWLLPLDSNKDSPMYNPADIVTQLSALYLIDANLLLEN